jgi:hypothetical protein
MLGLCRVQAAAQVNPPLAGLTDTSPFSHKGPFPKKIFLKGKPIKAVQIPLRVVALQVDHAEPLLR